MSPTSFACFRIGPHGHLVTVSTYRSSIVPNGPNPLFGHGPSLRSGPMTIFTNCISFPAHGNFSTRLFRHLVLYSILYYSLPVTYFYLYTTVSLPPFPSAICGGVVSHILWEPCGSLAPHQFLVYSYMFSVAVVTVQNPCLQVLYQTCHL